MVKKLLQFFFALMVINTFSQQKTWDKDPYYKEGNKKLNEEFQRAIDYAVDQNYVVYGKMTFTIFINDKGIAKIIDVTPKVKNQKMLIDDLNYVLKKSNKKWVSATKETKPVQSFYHLTINFNTEVYDHD
ncbi:MAG: hypothetical protein BGO40_04305 [Chryseobacterium sp. 39-10]|nr:hypothetical protein [Chryseobacterium sp.]OJV48934.1 MAG: hypothetical protein BGO40_04305 [Chryseobacterium sp. 39-10]